MGESQNQYMLKHVWKVGLFLVALFVIAFAITYVVMKNSNTEADLGPLKDVVGSVRVETVAGRRLNWSQGVNISDSVLKNSLESILLHCLDEALVSDVEVLSLDEDRLSRIFNVTDRGVVVRWSAKIPTNHPQANSTDVILKNCHDNFVFDPNSVTVGATTTRSVFRDESFESFLLQTDEEFDLRKIEFSTVTTPKFRSKDAVCPPLKSPSMGSIQPISCTLDGYISVGLSCEYSCNDNLTIFGENTISCLASGIWSNLPPVCSRKCDKLPQIENGVVYPESCATLEAIPPGTECFFYCDQNYALEGTSLICSSNGAWEGVTPLCKRSCLPLNSPKNGMVTPTACREERQSTGSVCSFECNKGFTLSGLPSISCDVNGRWSASQPSCRRGCPLLTVPAHGSLSPSFCNVPVGGREEIMEGIVCVYSCDDGYLLKGSEVVMCGEGGVWIGKQAECRRICKPLTLPPNMNAFPQSCLQAEVIEGTRCGFHCTGHTTMFGTTTSTICMETGQWSPSDASCHHTCPALPVRYSEEISPTSCTAVGITEGTKCSLKCNDGLQILGNWNATCLENGIWSAPLGNCYRKCSRLGEPAFGSVSPLECMTEGAFQGKHCEFSCMEGHTVEGLKTMVCMDDGHWAGIPPTCRPDNYFKVFNKPETACLAADFETLQVREVDISQCELPVGPHWWIASGSGHLKSAVMDKCMSANETKDSNVDLVNCSDSTMQSWDWWDSMNYTFKMKSKDLFMSSGSSSAQFVVLTDHVRNDSKWAIMFSLLTRSLFEDQFKEGCSELKNASVIVKPAECVLSKYIKIGLNCQFSCHPGYKLYGNESTECINRQWTGPYPTCKRACSPLTNPSKGNVSASCTDGLLDQDTKCVYMCQEMHMLVGVKEVVCLRNGNWSAPEPTCLEMCPALDSVDHGKITPKTCTDEPSTKGGVCTVECNFPYIAKGNATIECQENHDWSGNLSCSRGCDEEVGTDVIADCTTSLAHEGTTCMYTCNVSKVFVHTYPPVNGTIVRICQQNGMFNGSMPRCGSTCNPLTYPTDGTITPSRCMNGQLPEGQVCTVNCNYGYRFRGTTRDLTCNSDGQWSSSSYACESEVQFTIFNDEAATKVCGHVDEYTVGAFLKRNDLSDYKCYHIYPGSTWMWDGDMLQNIRSELCMAVQDLKTLSFSMIIMKACDKDDPAQQWDCENEYNLRLKSLPLYMTSKGDGHSFILVKQLDKTSKSEFLWKSKQNGSDTTVGGACLKKLKRCPMLGSIANAAVVPSSCETDAQDNGFQCSITCNSGYLLKKLLNSTITLNCLEYGAWRPSETVPLDALPVKCLKTCPALSGPVQGSVEPTAACTDGTAVYGTACLYKCNYGYELIGVDVVVCEEDGTWSHPAPYCRTRCGHRGTAPAHASSPYSEYPSISGCADNPTNPFAVNEGDICHYKCSGMHKLVGPAQRVCMADGNMNGTDPVCDFPSVAGGGSPSCPGASGSPYSIHPCYLDSSNSSTLRLCANYSCADGYNLVGESTTHCDVTTATWTEAPVCRKKCPDISLHCKDMHAGQICYMDCRFGETFSDGYGVLLCKEDGQWNETAPTCIDGPDFFVMVNVESSSTDFCLIPITDEAPFLNSLLMIERCAGKAASRWEWKHSNHIMHMPSRLCITASSIIHGARLYLAYCDETNKLQQWDCSSNPEKPFLFYPKFYRSHIFTTTRALVDHSKNFYHACLADPTKLAESNLESTKWKTEEGSVVGTLCGKRQNEFVCPPLVNVTPIDVSFSPSVCQEEWSSEGKTCNWFCTYGSPSVSSTTVKCSNGRWDSIFFSCNHFCNYLDHPTNGTITDCATSGEASEGTTCNMKCDDGTYVIGETARVCQWDGSWSGNEFKCATPCSFLDPTSRMVISPQTCLSDDKEPVAGLECKYSCMEGYHLSTKEETRTCLENGTWSGTEPDCYRVCPPLPSLTHGKIMPVTCTSPPIPAGTVCTISCDNGYLVNGNNTRVCQSDGVWTPETGTKESCLQQCKRIVTPENSEMTCSANGEKLSTLLTYYAQGSECRYSCLHNFAIDGPWLRKCGSLGAWSGEDPHCYQEDQFLIFLTKTSSASVEKIICLSANNDQVIKVPSSACSPDDPHQRWHWHSKLQLKNSGTGLCITVLQPYPGQTLRLAVCDSSDHRQHWSCDSSTEEWFLRMDKYDLYPDFGYSVVSSAYNQGSDDKNLRMTVCAMRRKHKGGICGALSVPSNGKVFPSICTGDSEDITTGLTCTYKCDTGFKTDTPTTAITCQQNGLWSGSPPKCEGFCHRLTQIPNMIIHPSSCVISAADWLFPSGEEEEEGVSPGGKCTVACENGYTLPDEKKIVLTCLESGRWSSAVGNCKRLCPQIVKKDHMSVTPASCFTDEQSQGTSCTLRCKNGYIVDVVHSPCDDSGNSTDSASNCTEEAKPDSFVQEVTKSCLGDGSWSGDPVQCISVCQPIVPPWNGHVSPSSCTDNLVREGTICSFSCDDGFTIESDSSRMCKEGIWMVDAALVHDEKSDAGSQSIVADSLPTCERYCSAIANNNSFAFISPAKCNLEKVPLGTVCVISCDSTFILVGESRITCLMDGSWDGTPAICIKKCPALQPIDNGDITPLACTLASLGSGAVCTFSCLDRFALVGSVTASCDSVGKWSSFPPKCEKRCFPLPTLYNGNSAPLASCFGNYIISNLTCEFSCNKGFALEGSEAVTCMGNGQWDEPAPKCVRQCPDPVVANAIVECSDGNNVWGTKCKVICFDGFSPSSLAEVTCASSGAWRPKLPQCLKTGLPMYVMQSLDGVDVCLKETNDGLVVRSPREECLKAPSETIKSYQWQWLSTYNIQNRFSGRCMAVHYVREDDPIVTSPCDTSNTLQLWECSVYNPFRLLLKDTEYSPSTYLKGSNKVVLQQWSDAHSYFSTLSISSVSFSSLCSRRSAGTCPALTDIPGGQVFPSEECKKNDVRAGAICGYQCFKDNAILVGEYVTQCLGNGLWLTPAPKCVDSCESLMENLAAHTYYAAPECVFDEPAIGLVCTAGCLTGYEIVGNPDRTCLETGDWSESDFECRRTCPVLPGIPDGKTDPVLCRSGTCTFSCNPGYNLEGYETITCKDDGTWDRFTPRCARGNQFQIISLDKNDVSMCVTVNKNGKATKEPCSDANGSQFFSWLPDRLLLLNGETGLCLIANSTKWGKVLFGECDALSSMQQWDCGSGGNKEINALRVTYNDAHYYLDFGPATGDNNLVMETQYYPSSRWAAKHFTGQGTACYKRGHSQCPPFVPPLYGYSTTTACDNYNDIRQEVECTVACNSTFLLESVDHAKCMSNGEWSLLPVCKGIQKCDKLLISSSTAQVIPSYCVEKGVNSGQSCTFECDQGFLLRGNDTITCLSNGTWSSDPPSCIQLCPPLSSPTSGTVDPLWCQGRNAYAGMGCGFSCDDGFSLIGPDYRVCKADGLWSGEDAKCIRYCPKLVEPLHGKLYPAECSSDQHVNGTVCQFSCDNGYGLQGSNTLVCSDGSWTDELPKCVKLNACPTVESVHGCDMKIDYEGLHAGSFVIPGSVATVSCGLLCTLSDGPSSRTCGNDRMCPPINVPFGVILTPKSCNYAWQANGTVCAGGCAIRLSGLKEQEIECVDTGMWSAKLKECTLSEDKNLADAEKKLVVARQSADCADINLSQQWKWHTYKQIRSVATNLCWAPKIEEGGIFLALKPCSQRDTSQTFTCGNIESEENILRVSTGNLLVFKPESSDVIQLSSSIVEGNLDWESFMVSDQPRREVEENSTKSIQNSICRTVCGGVMTGPSGFFSSPAHPSHYITNIICDWHIQLTNKKIILWLHDIDIYQSQLANDGHCIGDYVLILDGSDPSLDETNVLGQICGRHRTSVGPFIGLHGKIMIRFISDDTMISTGFSATWDSEPIPQSLTECGVRPPGNPVLRIVGGRDVNMNEIPWFASLVSLYKQQHLCGATFIHSQYLVTASHCFTPMEQGGVSSYAIGYGAVYQRLLMYLVNELLNFKDKNSAVSDNGETLVRVAGVFFNPDTEHSEVALIKIAEASSFTTSVACMPPPFMETPTSHYGRIEEVKDYCIVAGWDSEVTEGEINLHYVYLPIISDHQCSALSSKLFGLKINTTSTFCTAHFDSSRASICEGDHGSGIICNWNNNYYIVGVALNFQLSRCRELNVPKYFARTSFDSRWIKKKIEDN